MQDIMEFLAEQYQGAALGTPGEDPPPAALDELDTQLPDSDRLAARLGIEHFIAFAQQFLVEHPPQTQIMLASGFGVTLAGGHEVSLTPQDRDFESGALDNTPTFHVTEGRSIRGQGGVEPSEAAVHVTGNPIMRAPM